MALLLNSTEKGHMRTMSSQVNRRYIDVLKLSAFLAKIEIELRYNRSVIGPFWITISTTVVLMGLTLVYGTLFGDELVSYLFYLAPGLIFWTMLTNTVTDATDGFIGEAGIMRQYALNVRYVPFKTSITNFIIMIHNLIILVVLFAITDLTIDLEAALLSFAALILGFANLIWLSGLVAILSLRFRDLKNLFNSVMTLMFFATPIIWRAEDLEGKRSYLIDFNPVFYFIEMFRGPITGNVNYNSYLYMLILALFGLSLFVFIYRRYEKNIITWL